jgi:hypothetical protein
VPTRSLLSGVVESFRIQKDRQAIERRVAGIGLRDLDLVLTTLEGTHSNRRTSTADYTSSKRADSLAEGCTAYGTDARLSSPLRACHCGRSWSSRGTASLT